MTNHPLTRTVSRRAAIAGLGAGGLGLALSATAHQASAQDAVTETAAHPIIGTWIAPFESSSNINVYQADGTYLSLHPFAGTGFGRWQATGERTCDSILKYLNIAIEAGAVEPGTVTVWSSVTVDAAGTSTSEESVVELRGPDGAVVAIFPYMREGGDARLEVESPPPLPTPEPATPTG